MKRYLLFFVLVLLCMGAKADVRVLTFGEEHSVGSSSWKSRNVSRDDVNELEVGDFILVSYDEVQNKNCQYAITKEDGTKIITYSDTQDWFDCPQGDKDFDFTVTQGLLDEMKAGGLQIQYNGLSNLKIQRYRISENWAQYKPQSSYEEIMSTPQYIKDWYSGNCKITTSSDYVGKVLRVVCLETGDDSYAFLKKNDAGWSSLMSGSDKFSIAGWKYFEIKINKELNDVLRKEGLLIGGNNYFIAGVYVYGSDTSDVAWQEEDMDVVDTYTFTDAVGDPNWANAVIPGSFFEYKGQGAQISTEKLANTKNNIIRLVFEDGSYSSGAQVSAKDAVDGNNAAYIRQRNAVLDGNGNATNDFYYVNYADCSNSSHYDFELSDAITVFEAYNKPIVNSATGVKTGMLSSLLKDGLQIGAKNVKIKSVQLRQSMVSKYVTGYAEYVHPLSDQVWRPIALPYNLTQEQIKATFGEDAMICELGQSKVTKKVVDTEEVSNTYGISMSFQKITGDLNANYPYIIKLGTGKVASDNTYRINQVKADVRDFQSYEFRTDVFDLTALDAKMPEPNSVDYDKNLRIYEFEQEIKAKLDNVYMIFQSTAPVFDITNTSVGDVEIISGVHEYTVLNTPTDQNKDVTNYIFYEGNLYPVLTKPRNLKSGLAYVKFPAATYSLFNETNHPAEVSLSKLNVQFGMDAGVTGIQEVDALPIRKQVVNGVYNLCGQLVRKDGSLSGLRRGLYIVNGRKVFVK